MLQRTKREAAVETDSVVIKKYGNRRLYDTGSSRYVNLDDIAKMIRKGRQVKVLDAKTGDDLTRVILTQVITEDVREKPTGLPLELLRQLIVATDQTRQEFIMWYLKSAFDTYQTVQDAVQNRLGEMQSAILSPVQSVSRLLSGAAPERPRREKDEEIRALRARLAQMEGKGKKSRARSKPNKRLKTTRDK